MDALLKDATGDKEPRFLGPDLSQKPEMAAAEPRRARESHMRDHERRDQADDARQQTAQYLENAGHDSAPLGVAATDRGAAWRASRSRAAARVRCRRTAASISAGARPSTKRKTPETGSFTGKTCARRCAL
jgi:hypothetical protein